MDYKLIMVDGIDGCGKTTVIQHLKETLESKGFEVEVFRAFGHGPVGSVAYKRNADTDKTFNTAVDAYMVAVGQVETMHDFVLPALEQGKVVLLDRCMASFYAYQITVNGCRTAEHLYDTMLDSGLFNFTDSIYLWCDLPVEIAEDRIRNRQSEVTHWDIKDVEYKLTLQRGYKEYFHALDQDKIYIDSSRPLAIVKEQLATILNFQ